MADEGTALLKSTLAAEVPGYITAARVALNAKMAETPPAAGHEARRPQDFAPRGTGR
jgi:hypothetical protein